MAAVHAELDKNRRDPACPAEAAIEIVGGRWKLVILYWLGKGTQRFGELHRHIPGATQQMLTKQLRQLESDGLVSREVFKEIPPKVEYSLTEFGRTFSPILDALCDWGNSRKSSSSTIDNSCRTLKPLP